MPKKPKVLISENGPYLVSGSVPLAKERARVGEEGQPEFWDKGEEYPSHESYALCRCGQSKNKPFCDGSHLHHKFDGTETASGEGYLTRVEKLSGPELDLEDMPELCSLARFCHLAGGTWSNVENSGDPQAKKMAIQTANNCPAGRLVAIDKKTGERIEPKFSPAISVVEDVPARMSGPLWLKGEIELESAGGEKYKTRNRRTLCRCGQSKNKPFCDGSHLNCNFNDGDESLK
jgi:CDGSH-type Zn-finger protein